MEKYTLQNDTKVFYVTAESFPTGISAAYKKLHSILPTTSGRKFFGISYPDDKGNIIYKAAVDEDYEGEGEKFGCETFVIKKGEYISMLIENFWNDIQSIGAAFQKLLKEPDIDPKGCCVEVYLNDKDVRCMVRLQSS